MAIMRPRRTAGGVLAAAAMLAGVSASPENPVDASGLIARAAEQEVEDVGAWYDYRFRRDVIRESYDADGTITNRVSV